MSEESIVNSEEVRGSFASKLYIGSQNFNYIETTKTIQDPKCLESFAFI